MKRQCLYCSKPFAPKSPHHLFCCPSHKDHYNRTKSWYAYFKKLIQNDPKNRTKLSAMFLEELLEKQSGKCALSGITLTKVSGNGQVTTNASIDRIKAGRAYSRDNVRLVCNFVNSFRGNVTDEELRFFCRRIVRHGRKKA